VDWIPAPKKPVTDEKQRSQGGIALFMVIAAISVLSILVTEFTYVAQVNQKLAFDGLDQLKAHYLAKSGFKLSLLRLKAYQNIKNYVNGMVKASGGGDAAKSLVPQTLIDKVWSFPFFYPIPTNIPGMTPADKEKVKAFEKASGLEGRFSANIESESSKFNLNMILPGYAYAASPSPGPSASPQPNGGGGNNPFNPNPKPTPTPGASQAPFNPEQAREQLKTFLGQVLQPKIENDPEWADAYRDPHLLEDLVDNIAGWADRTYERKSQTGDIPMKRGPFYSVSELHMIPGMDDDLYNLFAPQLTVARTPGINVNTLKDTTLKALFPLATVEEIAQFFKDRDSEEVDGTFKSSDDFLKYIQGHFQAYERGTAMDDAKKGFNENHITFVTDENEFKITVQAQVNQSTRLIEAWVTLGGGSSPNPNPSASPTPQQPNTPVNPSGNGNPTPPDPGLKIHFMRVL
jgi:general secretion pathway protein K